MVQLRDLAAAKKTLLDLTARYENTAYCAEPLLLHRQLCSYAQNRTALL